MKNGFRLQPFSISSADKAYISQLQNYLFFPVCLNRLLKDF
jgi:hypothetical protein